MKKRELKRKEQKERKGEKKDEFLKKWGGAEKTWECKEGRWGKKKNPKLGQKKEEMK